ncbi:MAG: M23 family metallopeptidase [Cyanobacteria bacterium]|nr:M23 family metallopeptidase [Cyanobacteriota bacterium]
MRQRIRLKTTSTKSSPGALDAIFPPEYYNPDMNQWLEAQGIKSEPEILVENALDLPEETRTSATSVQTRPTIDPALDLDKAVLNPATRPSLNQMLKKPPVKRHYTQEAISSEKHLPEPVPVTLLAEPDFAEVAVKALKPAVRRLYVLRLASQELLECAGDFVIQKMVAPLRHQLSVARILTLGMAITSITCLSMSVSPSTTTKHFHLSSSNIFPVSTRLMHQLRPTPITQAFNNQTRVLKLMIVASGIIPTENTVATNESLTNEGITSVVVLNQGQVHLPIAEGTSSSGQNPLLLASTEGARSPSRGLFSPLSSQLSSGFNARLQFQMQVPVKIGEFSSRFGWRHGHHHSGLDITAPIGTPIYAAEAGTVIYSDWESGYGQSMIIDHGHGLKSRYAHCQDLLLPEGATVRRGQLLGHIGMTGRTTGPHLHFEVLANETPHDPENYLTR